MDERMTFEAWFAIVWLFVMIGVGTAVVIIIGLKVFNIISHLT